MARVKMPSGEVIRFPDFMSPEDINTAIETEIRPQFQQRGQAVLEHIRTLSPDSPIVGDRDTMIKALGWLDDPAAVFARDMLEQGLTVDEIHREFQGGYDPIATTASQVARPTLEAGGMALGEIAGAPLGPAMSMVGGGLGYAGGGNAADVLDYFLGLPGKPKTAGQELRELPGEVATGTGITMTGPIIGKAGQKVLGPFAGKLSPEARRLSQIAQEQRLPLSPSKIFPSKPARAFEWVSEKVPPGGYIKSWRGNQLARGLMRMHDDAMGKLPVQADKYEAGVKLGEAVKGAKTGLKAQAKEAYQAFESGMGDAVSMPRTAKLINEVKGSATGDLRATLEMASRYGEGWLPPQVDDFQKQIWNLTYKKNPVLGKRLTQALKDDLGPNLTGLLESAKDKWQILEKFNQNPTVRQIVRKYATGPDEVIYAAFRSGNIEDIKLIKSAVDKETWDIARSRFVENLLDAATDTSGQTTVFKPAQFVKLMDKYDRQIKNVMPEIYGNLRDFTAVTRAAIDDMSKREMTGFQKFLTEYGSIGLAGGAIYGKNPALLVPSTFTALTAKSLTNPKGWMKKWLTTGLLQGEGARQAITQGTKAVGIEAME